ncbi:hypothetical protein ACVRXF_02875 [Streptococcus orisasini]
MIQQVQFRGKEIKTDEFLFFLGFIPYLIIVMLGTTMFPVPRFLFAVGKAFLIFPFAGAFFKKSWGSQFFVTSLPLLAIGAVVWQQTSNTGIIALTLLMMGAYRLDTKKIIDVYLKIVIAIMILAFLASMVGIIPNLQYVRPESGIVRNSFGIIYPTDFAAHVFFTYLFSAYLYFEKRPGLFTALGLFLSFFVLKFSDARLDAITLFLAIILFLMVRFLSSDILHPLAKVATLSTPLACLTSYLLTVFYSPKIGFLDAINKSLSGRLHLGRRALNKYGLRPFGQVIKFVGNGGTTKPVSESNYNFVDSSYLKVALLFGVVFILFFVLLMTFQAINRFRRKDYYTLAVLVMISLNSIVAHHLIEPQYNIFVILFLANFTHMQLLNSQENPTPIKESES